MDVARLTQPHYIRIVSRTGIGLLGPWKAGHTLWVRKDISPEMKSSVMNSHSLVFALRSHREPDPSPSARETVGVGVTSGGMWFPSALQSHQGQQLQPNGSERRKLGMAVGVSHWPHILAAAEGWVHRAIKGTWTRNQWKC